MYAHHWSTSTPIPSDIRFRLDMGRSIPKLTLLQTKMFSILDIPYRSHAPYPDPRLDDGDLKQLTIRQTVSLPHDQSRFFTSSSLRTDRKVLCCTKVYRIPYGDQPKSCDDRASLHLSCRSCRERGPGSELECADPIVKFQLH